MNAPLTNGATGPADNSIRINPAVAASIEIQRPPPADLFGEPLPVITPAADLIQILLDRGWLKSRIAGAIGVHPAQVGRILSGQQTASTETHRKLLALVQSGATPDCGEGATADTEASEPVQPPVVEVSAEIPVNGEDSEPLPAAGFSPDEADSEPPAINPHLLLMTNIPPAMREARRWLLWRNEGTNGKARKVPYYVDGSRRQGALDTQADWDRLCTFEQMLSALDTGRYTGPGFALGSDDTGNHWQGIDLDHVDERPELAELGEKLPGYVETSPSGTGLHAIGYGLPFKSLGSNQTGIEAYAAGRYFTVTGNATGDQGDIEDLADFVTVTLNPLHSPARQAPAPAPRQSAPGESFHAKVNAKALQTLSAWVPALLPKARPYHDGFRVSSADLGRNLEEDLSILPAGIKDFGEEAGKTPVDLVLDWGRATAATEAALWLCSQIGIDPAALGWRGNPAKPQAEHRAAPDVQDEATHWPEPEPLRAPLPAAEPYPVDSLGPWLAPAVKALHETVKAPIALCAQSVLAAASFAAQAHFDAAMPWGEVKPLSLAMLTIGESGERKSGVDDLVLGAAKLQERQEMEAFESATENYEAELAAWKAANEQAKKRASAKDKGKFEDFRRAAEEVGPAPLAPVLPLRFVSDPTVEGLYKLLAVGQPSVALFSDEGGLLIGGHALNSDNALKTLTRWSKLWDGSPYDRVRGGDGSGILYGRRMALHQLAQPEVMTTLLSDGIANGQGFLARCLVAWPQSTIGTRHVERYEWGGDRPEIKRLFGRLKGLFETPPRTKDPRGQVLDPAPLRLTRDAEGMAIAANNQFETLMAPNGPLCEIRDRASKAMDNAIRIAGTLAVMDHGTAAKVIEAAHLQRGLELIQWYLAEALRIRGAAAIPQAVSDAELLLAWLKKRELRLFRSAHVLTGGPAPLRNKPRFMAAVEELVKNGYAVENTPGRMIEGIKTRLSWMVSADVF